MELTKQQKTILLHLLRFRFLTRLQLQSLIHHKHPGQLNKWLKHLSDHRFIFKIYSQSFPDNTKPAIYSLDKNSIAVLKQLTKLNHLLIKRIYKDKKRSRRFIEHSISVANLYLSLVEHLPKNHKLFFYTKTDLIDYEFLIKPTPDVYVAMENNGDTNRYFFEILNDDTPRFVLRHRVKSYIEYFLSSEWQNNTSYSFPVVKFLTNKNSILKYLQKYITKLLVDEGSPEIEMIVTDYNLDLVNLN